MQSADALPEILKQGEVASFLRVSSKTVEGMRARGQLRYFRAGGLIRFRREDVLAFAAQSAPVSRDEEATR